MNINSLRRLAGPKQLLVPSGLSVKLRKKGFMNVKELCWWESVHINGVRFTFVPAQHSTRRNPWDMNSSHWGGWIIERTVSRSGKVVSPIGASNHSSRPQVEASAGARPDVSRLPIVSESPTIYFAGDSGYFQGFKEIGRRFPIDVALMPIGAYEPEWFMGPQHVTPEQALQAFEDTGAGWFVPMHYGTFRLADDTPLEALTRLEADRIKRGIEAERVVNLWLGETWKLAGNDKREHN
ncbi:metal-dependent hydrolase [compost metagenome]